MIVNLKNEKEIIDRINYLIRGWLAEHPDVMGAYQVYYWNDDPKHQVLVDIEISDGGASVFLLSKLMKCAANHNNDFITNEELPECIQD